MERYEQLSFQEQPKRQANECLEECFDREGNKIHEGDYVRAVYGEPLFKGIEGFVEAILPYYEEAGNYIRVVTHGGKVLISHANPLQFKVVKE